ncbi:hypothetical protein GYA13_02850 [Candidatus Kuenenbacteria bacterium]|nr:hypothetical protein [Candidatus Kuenenbacteria bacterium]
MSPNTYTGNIPVTSNGGNGSVAISMTVPEPAPAKVVILWSGNISYGDQGCSPNKEGQFPGTSFALGGGSLTGMIPYVTVECSAGQQWYLLIYRSVGDTPEKVSFTGPGEYQICGPLPANFLGLRLGVEAGCVTGKKIVAKGQIPSAARVIMEEFHPVHLEAGAEK